MDLVLLSGQADYTPKTALGQTIFFAQKKGYPITTENRMSKTGR
jgi:hypothetical protein